MAAAPEIVWSVIRKNSSFKRSDGFSAEPVNVLNKHSYKYSGAVQPSVSIVRSGKGGFVAVNTTTKTNKPIKAKNVTNVKKGVARGTNAVNKLAWKNVSRPDQQKLALARFSKFYRTCKQPMTVKQGRK